jgi:hypothetical protein
MPQAIFNMLGPEIPLVDPHRHPHILNLSCNHVDNSRWFPGSGTEFSEWDFFASQGMVLITKGVTD